VNHGQLRLTRHASELVLQFVRLPQGVVAFWATLTPCSPAP
jgi:hypothetical protein